MQQLEDELSQMFKTGCDGIRFFPMDNGDIELESFSYAERGEDIPGSELGFSYDIMIYHEDYPDSLDLFQAILISPPHYISRMIKEGFGGVVSLATTKSGDIMQDYFNQLKNSMDDDQLEEDN